jgi:hypothetical protein
MLGLDPTWTRSCASGVTGSPSAEVLRTMSMIQDWRGEIRSSFARESLRLDKPLQTTIGEDGGAPIHGSPSSTRQADALANLERL